MKLIMVSNQKQAQTSKIEKSQIFSLGKINKMIILKAFQTLVICHFK